MEIKIMKGVIYPKKTAHVPALCAILTSTLSPGLNECSFGDSISIILSFISAILHIFCDLHDAQADLDTILTEMVLWLIC